MSKISRSEYQRVFEENKRLKRDLEIITSEGLSAEKTILISNYREKFKQGKEFGEMLRNELLNACKELLQEHES